MPRISSRNKNLERYKRSVPSSSGATANVDPFATKRRQVEIEKATQGYNTGEVDYDVLSSKIEKQKKNVLGGSFEGANLANTGQRAQLTDFGRSETAIQQDYQTDPTKFNQYSDLLQQHQAAFAEDSPFYLQYQSKITAAERGEQDRMDTSVANDYLSGSFSYTSNSKLKDASVGLNIKAGQQLTGFQAYQAYIAEQKAKYQAGTGEYVKYDSLLRQNYYAKEFSDIVANIGTTEEGAVEQRLKDLALNYQPGTPQHDNIVEQLKNVATNNLDNAYNQFLTNTVYPSIQAAQSKVDLDITNLVYGMSKGLKVTVDGKEYNFGEGTSQQQQDQFNTLYASLVDKKNQLANPNNVPQKPVLQFDPATLSYTFGIPNYEKPEYSSNISYTPPGEAPATTKPTQPAQRDMDKERTGIGAFGAFTGNSPSTAQDWNFVNISAYGYQGQRDQAAEQAMLGAYGKIFGKMPETGEDWNVLHAMTYSGVPIGERWA
jgi:hypothetical protein